MYLQRLLSKEPGPYIARCYGSRVDWRAWGQQPPRTPSLLTTQPSGRLPYYCKRGNLLVCKQPSPSARTRILFLEVFTQLCRCQGAGPIVVGGVCCVHVKHLQWYVLSCETPLQRGQTVCAAIHGRRAVVEVPREHAGRVWTLNENTEGAAVCSFNWVQWCLQHVLALQIGCT